MHGPTRHTHFNPTFWTALWNVDYFNHPAGRSPREQRVCVLDVRADKVYVDRLNDIHFELNLGLAPVTVEMAMRIAAPPTAAAIKAYAESHEMSLDDEVDISIEDLFTQAENGAAYRRVRGIIRQQRIETADDRAAVALFIAFQRFRAPEHINRLVALVPRGGLVKGEVLASLYHLDLWQGPFANDVGTLASLDWTLHTAAEHAFPLPDRPVMFNEGRTRLWVPLSPRMLLEVSLQDGARQIPVRQNAVLSKSLLGHYRSLAIAHTVHHVIFNDRDVLEDWRATTDWNSRMLSRRGAISAYLQLLPLPPASISGHSRRAGAVPLAAHLT